MQVRLAEPLTVPGPGTGCPPISTVELIAGDPGEPTIFGGTVGAVAVMIADPGVKQVAIPAALTLAIRAPVEVH